jgi:acetyl esterase/lipase
VLVLGDDIDEDLGICLKNDIYNALNFNNQTQSPVFCEWKNLISGSSGLLSFLEKYNNQANVRVLLLNCGIKDAWNHTDKSLQHYKVTLTNIVKKAKKLNMEILWYDTPVISDKFPYNHIPEYNRIAKDIMAEHKIYTIDFALFWKGICNSTQFNRDSIEILSWKKSEFLAESLAQWWTGAAHGNQSIKRMPLWKGLPPYYEFTNQEHINSLARMTHISTPELEYFLPQKRQNAPAVIFFPGGGYQQLGFLRNARELAELLNPYGISVIGLKYRTGRPLEVSLSDAQRAVRYVRAHAEEWGIDPNRIGIAGQSAGANLALNLCCNYSAGNLHANDKTEQMSSRPDFVALLTSWNFLSHEYPFIFKVDLPPFFVRHAKNDNSFLLAEQIVARLHENNIPVDALFIEEGGHGAFEIKDTNAGYKWPDDFVLWLRKQLIL